MTSERKDYQVAKLPFSVFFEAVNKRERDKLYKVILIAKITAKECFTCVKSDYCNSMNKINWNIK